MITKTNIRTLGLVALLVALDGSLAVISIVKTKIGIFTLAVLLLITGLLLDSSGAVISQAMRHFFFVLSGVAIGIGIGIRR